MGFPLARSHAWVHVVQVLECACQVRYEFVQVVVVCVTRVGSHALLAWWMAWVFPGLVPI